MRLILSFIFFGLLFYGMSIYFPDAFQVLVSWAAKVFDTARNFFESITGKTPSTPAPIPVPEPSEVPKSLIDVLNLLKQL